MAEEGRRGDPTATATTEVAEVATNKGETRRAKARGHGEIPRYTETVTGHGRRSGKDGSRRLVGSAGQHLQAQCPERADLERPVRDRRGISDPDGQNAHPDDRRARP